MTQYKNFEDKGSYSLQQKYEIVILIMFCLVLIFYMNYAVTFMFLICYPLILLGERFIQTEPLQKP
jgi:hypothetical protein